MVVFFFCCQKPDSLEGLSLVHCVFGSNWQGILILLGFKRWKGACKCSFKLRIYFRNMSSAHSHHLDVIQRCSYGKMRHSFLTSGVCGFIINIGQWHETYLRVNLFGFSTSKRFLSCGTILHCSEKHGCLASRSLSYQWKCHKSYLILFILEGPTSSLSLPNIAQSHWLESKKKKNRV